MTKGNLIKAARIGYLEAQQRLDWDLGDRVHYYDNTNGYPGGYPFLFVVTLCLSRFENAAAYGIIDSDNNYEGEHK